MESVITVRNLFKSFGTNHVLKDLSMDLYKGENLAVLGKSGSGKSVLIKCIIGLIVPDRGSIQLFDEDIAGFNQQQWDVMRSRVGFLFQSNALYDSMTVRENLEFPLRRHKRKATQKTNTEELIRETLSNVGLEHTIDMMPAELSGGMRKRIALARTLILQPEIILYDEPTTGLDPITSREISELIISIQKKYNTSSVIISHDMSCIRTVSNRVIMLIDGRCYEHGTIGNLQTSTDKKVQAFFE